MLLRLQMEIVSPFVFPLPYVSTQFDFLFNADLTADISYGLFLPLSSLYCISLITTLTSRVNLARHVGAVSDDGKDEDESNGTTDVASGVQIDVIQYVERDEPDGNIHEIRLNKSSRPRFDTWDRESKV